MSTLVDLRSALRLLLNDATVATYLWSDAVLNQHLRMGVAAYSAEVPRQSSTDINLVAAQRSYTPIRVRSGGEGGASSPRPGGGGGGRQLRS